MRKAALIFAIIILFCATPVRAEKSDSETTAKAAAVLELETNTLLYAHNERKRLPMASTTKVMTAIIAIENGNLDEVFSVCDEAYGVEGSSMYLTKNECISLRDLLYGLMLRSGNDASVAIACRIGGSIEGFCTLMNEKANDIGAFDTHFSNPNGLPADDHYTTAYDLALICSYAMKNKTFREIVSTQYYTADSGDIKRTLMNKNKLLFQYDGALGIKTGYTKAAGKCLTFSAERNDMTVVGAILNCPDIFPESMRLMDMCFSDYTLHTIMRAGTTVLRADVKNGNGLAVLQTAYDVKVPVKNSGGLHLVPRIYAAQSLLAPLKKGTYAGRLDLYNGDTLVTSCPLVVAEDVNTLSFFHYLHAVAERFIA